MWGSINTYIYQDLKSEAQKKSNAYYNGHESQEIMEIFHLDNF